LGLDAVLKMEFRTMQNKDETNTRLIVGEQNELLSITTTSNEACEKWNGKATRERDTTMFPRIKKPLEVFAVIGETDEADFS
jgi:hypothetical protein